MGLKTWSVKNEIQRRADKESWTAFWENLEPGKLIELKKVNLKEDEPGWYVLIANILRELKP